MIGVLSLARRKVPGASEFCKHQFHVLGKITIDVEASCRWIIDNYMVLLLLSPIKLETDQ